MKIKINRNGGSAVVVILILLGIMLIFAAANTATVNWLTRQVKLVEQQQIHRLAGHHPTK